MQKKIIALAVAGLVSGVAFAQTNVTVYGVVDVGYVYNKSDDAKFSGLNDGGLNGSRIGFRGEEALGNGLSAIFTLEYGTNAEQYLAPSTAAYSATAGNALNNVRQSFVGLKSTWGSLTLGRQYAPAYSYLGGTSSNEVTTVHISNALVGKFDSIQTGSGARWNNSISYNTPVVSGFQGRAIYGFGEKVGALQDTSDAGKFGLGGTYTNGPVYLTAVYQLTAKDDAVAVDDGIKGWTVGGAFDFKVVKVFANYIKEKNEVAAVDFDKKYWSLGASAPIGKAGSFIFEYASYKQDDVANNKTKGYSFGYNHNLSKRTAIYSAISRISNDKAAKNGFNGVTLANDDDSTNFAVGVRHFF